MRIKSIIRMRVWVFGFLNYVLFMCGVCACVVVYCTLRFVCEGCHIDELRLKLINGLYVSCQIPCYVFFFVWVHLPVFEIQILTWQILTEYVCGK